MKEQWAVSPANAWVNYLPPKREHILLALNVRSSLGQVEERVLEFLSAYGDDEIRKVHYRPYVNLVAPQAYVDRYGRTIQKSEQRAQAVELLLHDNQNTSRGIESLGLDLMLRRVAGKHLIGIKLSANDYESRQAVTFARALLAWCQVAWPLAMQMTNRTSSLPAQSISLAASASLEPTAWPSAPGQILPDNRPQSQELISQTTSQQTGTTTSTRPGTQPNVSPSDQTLPPANSLAPGTTLGESPTTQQSPSADIPADLLTQFPAPATSSLLEKRDEMLPRGAGLLYGLDIRTMPPRTELAIPDVPQGKPWEQVLHKGYDRALLRLSSKLANQDNE